MCGASMACGVPSRRCFDRGGVSGRVVQDLAGHKDEVMTDYYQQPMESQKRVAASVMDAQLRALRGA